MSALQLMMITGVVGRYSCELC